MSHSLYGTDVLNTFAQSMQPTQTAISVPDLGDIVTITKPFPSPVDWRDKWIYFMMIDRFNNPSATPRSQWDRFDGDRQGGTFEGIREQLPYLQNLGVGAIWLTPVLKNRQKPDYCSHHGYGIMDFLEVDPRFSSTGNAEGELINLIDEAHARGIYVIFDVVINHTGDTFGYKVNGGVQASALWRDTPYDILWRDEDGKATLENASSSNHNATVWPTDFQVNEWFRRQGKGGPILGDFETLKEFRTEFTDYFHDKPVWNILIRAYQYVIAKFDVDGFRIDTLKHVEREFSVTFCNAIREYALSIGKKNFFIFGESKSDDENVIAAYTGRFTSDEAGIIGADASLDFPLQWKLGPAVKGFAPPTVVEDVFNNRKRIHKEKHLISSHGEASRFFITFLDNHDDSSRFLYPRYGGDFTQQLTLGLGCIFGLQGIPCLYYGTEQGLKGTQDIYDPGYDPNYHSRPEHVREALWGKSNSFDQTHPIYVQIKKMAEVRNNNPALRYGRQYFRQVSGNNSDFGFSQLNGGVLAFSRILNRDEVIVVANTDTNSRFSGWVLIDARINYDDSEFMVAYSNHNKVGTGTPSSGPMTFYNNDGSSYPGWARRLYVDLAPMEIQILTRK